jgi:hypothetical protein
MAVGTLDVSLWWGIPPLDVVSVSTQIAHLVFDGGSLLKFFVHIRHTLSYGDTLPHTTCTVHLCYTPVHYAKSNYVYVFWCTLTLGDPLPYIVFMRIHQYLVVTRQDLALMA